MNKALLLAPGFLLASSAFGVLTNYDLTPYANDNLQTYTNGFMYPLAGSTVTVGGVPFTLSSLGGDPTTTGVVRDGNIDGVHRVLADIPVGQYGVDVLYTLINSAYGSLGAVIGDVTAYGAGGESYTYSLIEGQNVRDHYNGIYVNTLSDATVQSAYFGDGSVRLDMQTITLPSIFLTDTLTHVTFSGYAGNGLTYVAGQPFMTGFTTEAVPEPASLIGLGFAVLAFVRRRRR